MLERVQDAAAFVPDAEFLDVLRRRELRLFRADDPNRFDGLLSWSTLENVLKSGTYPVAAVRALRDSIQLPTAFFEKSGSVDVPRLFRLLEQGMSAVFVPLDGHVPSLRQLIESIKRRTLERAWSGAIVTTGSGGAFQRHYDSEDLVILQIEGTKRWLVEEPPVINPVRGMLEGDTANGQVVVDEVLHPGDLLFLPAGHWHRCENGSGRSLHVGLFVEPLTAPRILQLLTRRLLATEEMRRPLMRGVDAAGVEQTAKALLIEAVTSLSWEQVVAEHQEPVKSGSLLKQGY